MLSPATADTDEVLNRALASTALICCTFVAVSFGLFALAEVAGASRHQEAEIGAVTPLTPASALPPARHGQPRRFIDGVAHVLTSPFASLVRSDSLWVTRGVPTLCALLVYGLGLGYLARCAQALR